MIELASGCCRVSKCCSVLFIRSLRYLSCAAFLAGCVAPANDIDPVPRDTALLATSIKAALIESPDVDAAAIRVEAIDSSVVLDGFVASDEEAQQAETIARTLVPDRQIRNELEVH